MKINEMCLSKKKGRYSIEKRDTSPATEQHRKEARCSYQVKRIGRTYKGICRLQENLDRKEEYTRENAMEERNTELESSVGLLRTELGELRGKLRTLLWFQIGSLVILIAVIIITWLFPHFSFGGGGMPNTPQIPP